MSYVLIGRHIRCRHQHRHRHLHHRPRPSLLRLLRRQHRCLHLRCRLRRRHLFHRRYRRRRLYLLPHVLDQAPTHRIGLKLSISWVTVHGVWVKHCIGKALMSNSDACKAYEHVAVDQYPNVVSIPVIILSIRLGLGGILSP